MSTAKLFEIQPQPDAQCCPSRSCFSGMWWFELQDDFGNMASIPVMQSEWAELMRLVPDPISPQSPVHSSVLIDRVLVKTCMADLAGWGRECVMPHVETVCDNQQLINSIVTGIVVPVFGWLIVYCFFKRLPATCMSNPVRQSRDYDTHDEGNLPTCKIQGLLICCLVAILACGALAAGSSYGISHIFGAFGCLHGVREMMVIGCAAGIPGAMAIIFGLLYVYCSGNKHGGGKQPEAYQPPKGHKLMLVEVEEDQMASLRSGSVQGVPLNPDILQTGNSAMRAYGSAGGPRQINIDSTAMDLGGFQSGMARRPGGE